MSEETNKSRDTEGTLVTFTVIRKPPTAFKDEPPYAVAVVDLTDGRRVLGRLETFEPEPALGSAVALAGEHKGVPVFRAAS